MPLDGPGKLVDASTGRGGTLEKGGESDAVCLGWAVEEVKNTPASQLNCPSQGSPRLVNRHQWMEPLRRDRRGIRNHGKGERAGRVRVNPRSCKFSSQTWSCNHGMLQFKPGNFEMRKSNKRVIRHLGREEGGSMRWCINSLPPSDEYCRSPCFADPVDTLTNRNQGEDEKKMSDACFETKNDDVDVNLLHRLFQFPTSFCFRIIFKFLSFDFEIRYHESIYAMTRFFSRIAYA